MGSGDFLIENGALKKYVGTDPDVIVPEGVTSVYGFAFDSNRCRVRSIVFPESLKKIEFNVLGNCVYLESVTLPSGICEIKTGAFSGCKNLRSIVLPDSVTEICEGLFSNCGRLESVVIPDSVEKIGDDAFYGCEKLISVNIPGSVKTIGTRAFNSCESLKAVTIPESVTSIGADAFSFCDALTSVRVSESTSLASGVFSHCPGLADEKGFAIVKDNLCGYFGKESVVVIPDGVKRIDAYAFAAYDKLTDIIIPGSVTEIRHGAFSNCKNLTSVQIPHGVRRIDTWCFEECEKLKSVTIPESVTEICHTAFGGCKSLTSLTFPSDMTSIDRTAFVDCINLSSVTFNGGLKNMDKHAFSGCYNLTDIVLPDGITDFWRSPIEELLYCFSETDFYCTVMLSAIRQYPHLLRDNRYVTAKIKANRNRLFKEILKSDDVESLEFIFSLYQKVSSEKLDEYIEMSLGNVAVTAFLLDYKNKGNL